MHTPSCQQPAAFKQENAAFTFTRGTALVLVDGSDEPWDVFDCMVASGRLVVVGYGSARVTCRVFAPVDGPKRVYTFMPNESRVPDAELLVRQLAKAKTPGD